MFIFMCFQYFDFQQMSVAGKLFPQAVLTIPDTFSYHLETKSPLLPVSYNVDVRFYPSTMSRCIGETFNE